MLPPFLFRSVAMRGAMSGAMNCLRGQRGGCKQNRGGGCKHPAIHFLPAFVRFFRARPDDPSRASGEGEYGSDPPFLTAGAVSRGGGCKHGCKHPCQTPPPLSVGVAPVVCIPAGRLPGPTRATADQPRRGARCLTHSSALFLSSAASVPWPRGRGPACFPRPIPWPFSSATTPRTFTPPSSPGTTSRRAWPCSSSANSSSARLGSGSPGWASVSGSGRAFPRGRFRLRRTARRSSSGRYITRSNPSRARAPNG